MRVLAVDDSELTRLALEQTLRALGHECLLAEQGDEAWALFQRERPDVVISDWVMPGLSGPELCQRVRASPGRYTYFILLTMLGEQRYELEGLRAGADDYLRKPADADQINGRLVVAERVTELHRQLAEREGELERQVTRSNRLLGVARRLAAICTVEELLADLLCQAVALVGGDDGAIALWDKWRQELRHTRLLSEGLQVSEPLSLDETVSGRVAKQRRPLVVGDYQREYGPVTPIGRRGARAVVGVPLLHEGELLGTVIVVSRQPERRFSQADTDALEVLAGIAAAGLFGLERTRLEGVLLAARTAQHELNNRLGITAGFTELIAADPTLPEHLRAPASQAREGAYSAAETVNRLLRLTDVRETTWGIGTRPTIQLDPWADNPIEPRP